MSDGDQAEQNGVLFFGPFRLRAAERLLLRNDIPVEVGGRPLDLLIALTERAGQIVSRWELMDRVWPATTVEEATLRMHMTALRRALGDGQGSARYIVNVPGRGYSFVAPLEHSGGHDARAIALRAGPTRSQSLPAPLRTLIGRSQAITDVTSLLLSRRFVSIIGPGGIGKTSIAVAAAHALRDDFDRDAVCFVDLSAFTDPTVVAGSVASVVGCVVQGADAEQSLLAFLAEKRMLIVLDSCEHVIKAAASLAERLFNGAPSVHLLTTSRETLRVEGENVVRLSPLEIPLDDAPSATEALASSAVQLFMESAAASGYDTALTNADAPIVAGICRRLDGIALAIELAASRVGTYGIQGTADLLDNGAGFVLQGRRSAQPRHQTLHALLDWSFGLLSTYERRLFCWLSVFVGAFTIDAAQSVAVESCNETQAISNALLGLVDKSLITISQTNGPAYFRLLDTTRAYAAGKLLERRDADDAARRHARYFAEFLRSSEASASALSRDFAPHMGNIRSALEWSFSGSGDPSLAVLLAVRAIPLFMEFSLYPECHKWCRRALDTQRDEVRGTKIELELQEALAISSMWTRGASSEVRAAIERGLELSKSLGDGWRQIHFLVGLNILVVRVGDFSGALATAERAASVANETGNIAGKVITEWMLGASYHYAGDMEASVCHCERGFQLEANAPQLPVRLFGFDQRVRARVALARSLWLLGKSDQGRRVADRAISEAAGEALPISHCIALLYCIPVFLWQGAFEHAAELIESAISTAHKYSLVPYHAFGLALKGELTIAKGDAPLGVEILTEALKVLKDHRHDIVIPTTICALAEGHARCGQPNEALALIDDGLAYAGQVNEMFWLPDLLRVRGETLLTLPIQDWAAAENVLQRSIDCARQQSALSWELRAAIPLARLWGARGRFQDARVMLGDIYARFTEGFETRDLVAARRLLKDLRAAAHPAGK